MKLIVFHRLLVSTSILFCGVMVWFQAIRWKNGGGFEALAVGAAFVVVAVALCWYLLNLKRFVKLDR